jgi:hypothetical protein
MALRDQKERVPAGKIRHRETKFSKPVVAFYTRAPQVCNEAGEHAEAPNRI